MTSNKNAPSPKPMKKVVGKSAPTVPAGDLDIYLLRVALDNLDPAIYRDVLVPKSATLEDLHRVAQAAFGWSDQHEHGFSQNGTTLSGPAPEPEFWSPPHIEDLAELIAAEEQGFYPDAVSSGPQTAAPPESKRRLDELLGKPKDKLNYVYDPGSNWEHTITLMRLVPADPKTRYPLCVGGQFCSPPEGSGGVPGFLHAIINLMNPSARAASEKILGKNFDHTRFELEDVNAKLHPRRAGI